VPRSLVILRSLPNAISVKYSWDKIWSSCTFRNVTHLSVPTYTYLQGHFIHADHMPNVTHLRIDTLATNHTLYWAQSEIARHLEPWLMSRGTDRVKARRLELLILQCQDVLAARMLRTRFKDDNRFTIVKSRECVSKEDWLTMVWKNRIGAGVDPFDGSTS